MDIKMYLDNCRALGMKVDHLGDGFTVRRPENYGQLAPAIQWTIDRHLGILDRAEEEIGYASRR
jgi:hypothetical protein